MVTAPVNPETVLLEVLWLSFEGEVKDNVLATTASVYTRDASGTRIELLTDFPLSEDTASGSWKGVWAHPPLTTPGQYTIEFHGEDTDGVEGTTNEELVVYASEEKLDNVLDCLLGRQKLDATTNRWTLFRRDGSVLKVFDVTDDLGAPSVENVFERTPA